MGHRHSSPPCTEGVAALQGAAASRRVLEILRRMRRFVASPLFAAGLLVVHRMGPVYQILNITAAFSLPVTVGRRCLIDYSQRYRVVRRRTRVSIAV